MEISIPIAQGLDLKITDKLKDKGDHATSCFPKGFLLFSNGQELTEEAVGFGFPVLKRGLQTMFPGGIELAVDQRGSIWSIQAVFAVNQVEKISRAGTGTVENRLLYAIKDFMAAVIRRVPMVRGLLTAISSKLRQRFHWETMYADAGFSTDVKVSYTIEEKTGKVLVEIDTSGLPPGISEVVIMNELGAHYFDRYLDTSGISLQGDAIGCWDEVTAQQAWFESRACQAAFRLHRVEGARLFRGRELISSRLAWAGFGYSFPPSIKKFNYKLEIERLA